MEKRLLIRNNQYNDVRLNVFGDEDGLQTQYYTEAYGDRFYFNIIQSTASKLMESANFNSFLSFTMSSDTFAALGDSYYVYDLIPIDAGETVMIDTKISVMSINSNKAYLLNSFGGFKSDGTSLTLIGTNFTYDIKTDFQTLGAYFTASGTQSIQLHMSPDTRDVTDWNIHISYTKGFHSLMFGTASGSNIYPRPPEGGATSS